MEIREATETDIDDIRSIARESLAASYTGFLDEATIEGAVEQWYDDDALADQIDDEYALLLVADTDDEGIVAFSQSDLVGEGYDTGRIHWLHVDPDHRGRRSGVRLLVRTREGLLDTGADHVQALVLEDNEVGNAFYESHGFERAGTREVEIGDESYTENVYVESDLELDDEADWRAIEPYDLDDETIYVSYGEASRGSKAPFYTAYRNEAATQRYGWFCGNCDTMDNAMDTMGRIECNVCGNRRKHTRWDASYL